MAKRKELNEQALLKIFQPEGALHYSLPGFERREVQEKMLHDVVQAFNKNSLAFVEAGTGTGKSFAYLVPAILWAYIFDEPVAISTKTIQLQEQLIEKDIPLLLKALQIECKVSLVKGMSNYLCLRKLEEAKIDSIFYSAEENAQIQRIDSWKNHTQEGSLSDLDFMPTSSLWENLRAERDTCTHRECPHFKECHFFQARRDAQGAKLLVVNHHLLFSDLTQRMMESNYEETGVLPIYKKIVIDEAHHIEDIATQFFASELSYVSLLANLNRIAGDRMGRLRQLQEHLQKLPMTSSVEYDAIMEKLTMVFPKMRNDLQAEMAQTFQSYGEFLSMQEEGKAVETSSSENKLRIIAEHHALPSWNEKILIPTQRLKEAIEAYVVTLSNFDKTIRSLDVKIEERTRSVRFEIAAYVVRLTSALDTLSKFTATDTPPSRVRWLEQKKYRQGFNLRLVNAELDPSAFLPELLFNKFSSVILCSATLTTNQQFDFIKKRLGATSDKITEKEVIEKIYESPFNFQKQSLFLVPSDISSPQELKFMEEAPEQILEAVRASQGNAFVLFTSYQMLNAFYNRLETRLKQLRMHPLKQGDYNRQALIEKFKTQERSILFGTDSFWEGVDIIGDKLRCVIITKLPFKVPSEPLTQARMEYIISQGGDSFQDYSLPEAIMKFKQGFGRLIRHQNDRGCVVCLDARLMHKNYGRQFLNSLPLSRQLFIPKAQIYATMRQFYADTRTTETARTAGTAE